MSRTQLRKILAFASVEVLGKHTISIPNIKRYVVPRLTEYNIRKDEPISNKDIRVAYDLVLKRMSESQNPIHFRFGQGELWRETRRKAFLSPDSTV